MISNAELRKKITQAKKKYCRPTRNLTREQLLDYATELKISPYELFPELKLDESKIQKPDLKAEKKFLKKFRALQKKIKHKIDTYEDKIKVDLYKKIYAENQDRYDNWIASYDLYPNERPQLLKSYTKKQYNALVERTKRFKKEQKKEAKETKKREKAIRKLEKKEKKKQEKLAKMIKESKPAKLTKAEKKKQKEQDKKFKKLLEKKLKKQGIPAKPQKPQKPKKAKKEKEEEVEEPEEELKGEKYKKFLKAQEKKAEKEAKEREAEEAEIEAKKTKAEKREDKLFQLDYEIKQLGKETKKTIDFVKNNPNDPRIANLKEGIKEAVTKYKELKAQYEKLKKKHEKKLKKGKGFVYSEKQKQLDMIHKRLHNFLDKYN